jgi:hypothetical protein
MGDKLNVLMTISFCGLIGAGISAINGNRSKDSLLKGFWTGCGIGLIGIILNQLN